MRISVLTAMLLGLLAGCGGSDSAQEEPDYTAPEPRAERPAPKRAPNLLVVMTDDQSVGSFNADVMPNTTGFFEGGGTNFDQAIASPPLCCPSRAGFLTGRYAQNHRVLENEIGYASMEGQDQTFPIALQASGYRTAMIGKFLNGYGDVAGAAPAPGFDRWFSMQGSAEYTDYEVSDDGERRFVKRYATDELTEQARVFVGGTKGQPFFLWLSYNAPHTVLEGNPPPCDGLAAQPPPDPAVYEAFAGEPLPRPPSFDEKDTSDRPSLAIHPDPLGPKDIAEATDAWRCSLAAMRAVDDQLDLLLSDLRDSGELDNTVVVYLSDNGYYYGEHRLIDEKRLPLEPALRIPMAVRVGEAIERREARPAQTDALVSQVDLAPTLLDFAGVPLCPRDLDCAPMDGRSLRPLLEGEAWQTSRAIPLTLEDGWAYEAMRTDRELYMELTASRKEEFDEPQAELYELDSDPDQLDNLAAGPAAGAARLEELSARLARITDCAGIAGRDPRTDGRPFCD
jgi:N-acetylglucosamine-6-sulfatase